MLIVHRSERADLLVEALGDLLLHALEDPMASEVVSVPTRGVERWLSQRLSHRLGAADASDGVCANIVFPFPGSLVGEATSIACGFDPETDPWPPERSVWPLLELVDENFDEPFLSPLAAHLAAGSPDGEGSSAVRRFPTVRHLADLYDRYSVHRPAMITSWASGSGSPEGAVAGGFGNGAVVDGAPPAGDWQRELWLRLRERIGVPSPAERLEVARAHLVNHPEQLELPERLSLFGLTRLPASHLLILEAVAAHRDVHLFLLHPSARLWDAVQDKAASITYPLRRSDDPTVALAHNALLRSWGRDSREMQLVLRSYGVRDGDHRPVQDGSGGSGGGEADHPTLLHLVQSDIRADREPPGAPRGSTLRDQRLLLDPGDASLRVHSCHGRLRQVEVMRDAILHLLAADRSLEPRDVIVMCPDVETFAPLIHAVFGSGRSVSDGDVQDKPIEPGPPQMRVRLADRSIRQTNPILGVAARLLELAAGRVTASDVLDLAGQEPVSRRFRFDEDDLGQLERWVAATGIRWGLDSEHRIPWKLDQVEENTWRAGLDRLLLGVAMAEEEQRLFSHVLPLDDVPSGAVDLAGRFAELIERLRSAVDALQGRQTVGNWCDALACATESLAAAASDSEWQQDQLRRVLGEVADTAGERDRRSPLLDLAEVRSVLTDRLRGRPTRANFRTGDLTICTLVPMRSVPHRVVGLLGLDDGAFPRHGAFDGDDLLLADPHVGDRDGRAEDRQLLLDALLAATEHLIVTYEGRDPRTNQERSPCVPIAELLDVVDRTVRLGDRPGEQARRQVVVEHPLQSFDQRNFCPDELIPDVSWSFDPVELDGAQSLAAPTTAGVPFLQEPLPPLELPAIQLESLIRFLEHPVRAFLRERLGWYRSGDTDEVKDALPVDLDALERWDVGARMLAARLAGATLDDAKAAERGRGLLPPGALGTLELQDIEAAVEALIGAVAAVLSGDHRGPGSVEVNVRLPDGRLLIGTVPDVYESSGPATDGPATEGPAAGGELRIVRCEYSQLAPKHRLAAWARFLALTAARPDARVSATTVGRGEGRSQDRPRVAIAELSVLEGSPSDRQAEALAALGVLVDLYGRGMCEPLPLYTKTSEKYVDALRHEEDAKAACRKMWESGMYSFGENREPEHRLVLGGDARFDQLLKDAPVEGENGPGWGGQPSRFGRLAFRLWEPLLSHESRSFRA